MSHTPGPWMIKHDFNVFGGETGERLVASCGGRQSNMRDEYPENVANARLIAAAPEMLEALEEATFELAEILARDGVPYMHNGYKSSVDEIYFESVVIRAKAAIAKAKGEI